MQESHMHITKLTPQEFDQHVATGPVFYEYIDTPAGKVLLLATDKGIFQATFVERVQELAQYRKAKKLDTTKLLLMGTEFQLKVWQALLAVPAGKTISYSALAEVVGNKKASRAVGNAVGQNNIAYFVPCHRVVRAGGALGGYAWGTEKKKQLLKAELKN